VESLVLQFFKDFDDTKEDQKNDIKEIEENLYQ
jgi:hypothetical protein